ncbi:MAG: hypothetical protein EAZ29_12910, partial [Runella slithyformis]
MNATSNYTAKQHHKLCLVGLFCLWQLNISAQTLDSTTKFNKWGVEIGYGPTVSVTITDPQAMAEVQPLWRTQVGVSVSHLLGKKSFLSYKLLYRSFGSELPKFGAARRYSYINFIGASLSYNRFLFRKKLIVGANFSSEYRFQDYLVTVQNDGSVSKQTLTNSVFPTHRLFRWGAGLNCQMPVRISNKLSARIGLEYS